jgi:hypothetical protein
LTLRRIFAMLFSLCRNLFQWPLVPK